MADHAPRDPDEPKARIVIFSGPRATIQNSPALRTGTARRRALGAPVEDGFDAVRSQYLAAPVTAYVTAYSAHPLERDAAAMYGPVDGWLRPDSGEFSEEPVDGGTPVYRVELDPADGPYLLPYAATRSDGSPWDDQYGTEGTARQLFYPDASRIVSEIDRFAVDGAGYNNLMSSVGEFEFVRAAPSGGYTLGLPEIDRTDHGAGDISPEVLGEDFFPYMPARQEPALPTLAKLTNIVADTLAAQPYDGAIWLEGSPTTEETVYWLGLLIPTTVPIVGNCSQYGHGVMGNDGDHNLIQSTHYIASHVWADEQGVDRIGAVMIQNGQIFTAREVQKADARPGGYVAMGGHGGIVGNTVVEPVLTFAPLTKHTSTSELTLDRLPSTVPGVRAENGALRAVEVAVTDAEGHLVPSAMPKVTIAKYVNYGQDDFTDAADSEVEVLARIEKNLADHPLAGIVAEGSSPYGGVYESLGAALRRAVVRGMPVVTVGRGGGGFAVRGIAQANMFISGSNLTAPKARMLLMAALLKFGALPVPEDPDAPTAEETAAIRRVVSQYQAVFDTH
jgi:L-asparaginase